MTPHRGLLRVRLPFRSEYEVADIGIVRICLGDHMTAEQAAQLDRRAAPWRPRIFMSYARHDQDAVEALIQNMRELQYPIWVDRNLTAGVSWWDEILRQIRGCDVVIAAVSQALLRSDAARAEQMYALKLGKPLLPVMIFSVKTGTLPAHLSNIQLIDFTSPTPLAGFELATALISVNSAPPLPEELPPPPTPPGIYELADRVQASDLSVEDQLSIVTRLKVLLGRPEDRAVGAELLKHMQQRQDLYHVVVQEMAKIEPDSRSLNIPEPSSRSADPDPDIPPPGWYPDPSGRHELRWFDDDWTAYACDSGVVREDPDF